MPSRTWANHEIVYLATINLGLDSTAIEDAMATSKQMSNYKYKLIDFWCS